MFVSVSFPRKDSMQTLCRNVNGCNNDIDKIFFLFLPNTLILGTR